MVKTDYKKLFPAFKAKAGQPALLEVPAYTYLMVDGRGNPNTSPAYTQAIEALYSLSYILKFMAKNDLKHDYTVLPLEGLWWAVDMNDFTAGNKDNWLWTMMIMQPPIVTPAMVEQARKAAIAKKLLPALGALRMETFTEGWCAQVLHIGPYSAEGPTIAALHQFIQHKGGSLTGKHHEIYLGDPRKSAPEKLRTIIRQPCQFGSLP
ncbi:MAG: hypothetical protein EBZ77_02945 [Chitinophagia bacterium]|nr:hypothetical protein [Chitinophagia bacterium]